MDTPRRTAASIGERLDHHMTLGGDLVAQVDRSRLGERRLRVPLDVGADTGQSLLESVEEHVAARLREVEMWSTVLSRAEGNL